MINISRLKPGVSSSRFARQLRASEFGDGKRAGICLMGACQDCRVWTVECGRLRACTTVVEEGMHIITQQPEAAWPNLA